MIKCQFDLYLYNREIYLDSDVYVDSIPEKDKEGNWKPILLKFNLNKYKGYGLPYIASAFFDRNSAELPVVCEAMLFIDSNIWYLNVWPKSILIDNESNCEILWQFKDAKLNIESD